jgi:TolB protein
MSTISHNLRFVAVLVATFALAGCVGVFFAPPKIAHATVPGVNGKIAYESHDGSDYEIYTIDPTGGTPFNVTDNTTNDFYPSYSPDGTKIAYENSNGIDSTEIFTINASGGTPFNVTNSYAAHEEVPNYSPEGTKIAYSGWDGNDYEIYTISVSGGTPSQLTDNATNDTNPSYSPGGAKIAYSGWDGTNDFEIYTINASGGSRSQVTNSTTHDSDPSYSPDGTKIAYAGYSGTNDFEIYTINAGGGTPSQLTNNNTDDINPSWGIAHNDDFAYARQISTSGGVASVSGTTEGATREAGEPDHYTSNPNDAGDWLGEHTVWYSWKAPDSGSTTIDTCQANIDSILAVYTGAELNNLSRVADNNNDHAYCPSESWGSKVTFEASAGTTYRIAVGDAGGLRESTFTLKLSTPRDAQAPKVKSTVPAAEARGIAPGANISATFSEAMMGSSLTSSTFKLMKAGTTTTIDALVTYEPTTKKAILNPTNNLRLGTKYKAVVSTGAKDLAGNALDQNSSQSGLQQKSWTFTTRN